MVLVGWAEIIRMGHASARLHCAMHLLSAVCKEIQ